MKGFPRCGGLLCFYTSAASGQIRRKIGKSLKTRQGMDKICPNFRNYKYVPEKTVINCMMERKRNADSLAVKRGILVGWINPISGPRPAIVYM